MKIFYEFIVKIYNLRITHDYERFYHTILQNDTKGAKDHDYSRAIHMKDETERMKINKRERTHSHSGVLKRD